MALTLRQNGSGVQNLVTSSWWNDYYNLLTGTMTDQPVKIVSSLCLQLNQANPPSPTCTAVSGIGLNVGTYIYTLTFVDSNGAESFGCFTPTSVTTTSTNGQVNITIPLGPAGVVARNIYRTQANGHQFYFLRTVNDNTTTIVGDVTSDNTLGPPQTPAEASMGGILFRDQHGTLNGLITGNVTGTGGVARLAYVAPNGGGHSFQAPAGIDLFDLSATQATLNAPLTVTGSQLRISTATNSQYGPFVLNNAQVPFMQVGLTGLGVKDFIGTKLFEVKSNGDVLSAGKYMTTQGTFSTATGQSFDNFDLAEIYECDQEYPNGTVVCPGEKNQMTKCTHDNCYAASIISYKPGFQLGEENHTSGIHPIALVGRVNAKTAYDIAPRQLVCSDGRGGVRPLKQGEWGYALGFALNETANGQVGIFIRNMFCRG